MKKCRTKLWAGKQTFHLWSWQNSEEIYNISSKGEVTYVSYNQSIHQQELLGVYLRLMDIPIPGSYGSGTDENYFT